jgi:hypothetical protein
MEMIKKSFKVIFFFSLAKLISFIKVSFLVGSSMIWFSGINSIVPLTGAFAGVTGALFVFLMRQIVHLFFFKTISLSFLAFCLPGFCASLYWATNHPVIRVGLPLLCIGLFIAHPVGSQAFLYSFYWFIPVILYASSRQSLFLQSLGSTFIAHAVGSVIWLYTVPMTAGMWLSLIPVVIIERVLFALGMIVMHQIMSFIFGKIDAIIKPDGQSAISVTTCL